MDKFLKEKIDSRKYTVGIIGLGYVGLPLAFESVSKGFPTIGFDIDPSKIELLKAGKTYIKHFPESKTVTINGSGIFEPTGDFSKVSRADAILICVPTPLTSNREPDMTYIVATINSIFPYLKKNQLIVLESTTYPGTTEEIVIPLLEKSGLRCGEDLHVAYSPEREDPGNKDYTTNKIPKVVGGYGREALDLAAYLYGRIVEDVVTVSSTSTAEAVKLTENIFRCVNIALVNELKMIYSKMGIDIWEVIEAAKTKPFGFMPFYPGPGLGGHCIPIDPFYLTWKAREYDTATRFIETAGEINTSMPAYVVQELMNGLNEQGKPLRNSRILIIGLAYKKDVDDTRESPSLRLMVLLAGKGALTDYHDPHVSKVPKTREYSQLMGKESVELTPENISSYDAVLISTDHSCLDYEMIVEHSSLVVDTRNATKNVRENRAKIIKA